MSVCTLYSAGWASGCVKPWDPSPWEAEGDSCRGSLGLTEAKDAGSSPWALQEMLDTEAELRMKGESGQARTGSSLTAANIGPT